MAALADMKPGAVFRLPDGRVCIYDGRSLASDAVVCHVTGTGGRLPMPPSTSVEPIDVPALARENADLRAMVADLWEESRAFAAGVEVGRGEARAILESHAKEAEDERSVLAVGSDAWLAVRGRLALARCLLEDVRALGPARPPLRPHALEAEVERLRGALRGLLGAISGQPWYGAYCARAIATARKVLGDA